MCGTEAGLGWNENRPGVHSLDIEHSQGLRLVFQVSSPQASGLCLVSLVSSGSCLGQALMSEFLERWSPQSFAILTV